MKKYNQLMINCDMGESFGAWQMGADKQVMPWVDMANIACGFHASDPHVMSKTVELAKLHDVRVGAHPGYQDLQGFGRRSIRHTAQEITEMAVYQVGALEAIAKLHQVKIDYIKPHGALYNDMMSDITIFESLVKAALVFKLPLMILATNTSEHLIEIADKYEVPLLYEAFADRAYLDSGLLTPRSHPGAVLSNPDDIFSQVMQLANEGMVTSVSGQKIKLLADTVCIHGDNEHSISAIERIYKALRQGG